MFLVVCFTTFLVAGQRVAETRKVPQFDRIVLSGIGSVTLVQGPVEKVIVEADSDIIAKVITEVNGDELSLELRSTMMSFKSEYSKLNYTVYLKTIHGISISGVGSMKCKDLRTGSLSVRISGSGEISISDLRCDDLDVRISGAGECELAGEIQNQTVTISGSGDYHADRLRSNTAQISISGAGNAVLQVEETMDVTISGSGDLEYFGSPRITQTVTGSGRIQPRGAIAY